MKYQKSMVKVFTFMILLSTTACLVLYVLCSLALLRLRWTCRMTGRRSRAALVAIRTQVLRSLWMTFARIAMVTGFQI